MIWTSAAPLDGCVPVGCNQPCSNLCCFGVKLCVTSGVPASLVLGVGFVPDICLQDRSTAIRGVDIMVELGAEGSYPTHVF